MNPVIQKALESLITATEQAGAVAWEQAPLLLHDLIVKGMIEGGIALGIGVLLLALCAWCVRKVSQEEQGVYGNRFEWGMASAASGAVSLLLFCLGAAELLTIWLAPRAYLLSVVR